MIPLRKLSVLVLLALVVSACGSTDRVVAEVNGRDIHQSDVLELRDREGTFVPGSEFRNDLNRLVLRQVVQGALEDEFGVVVTQGEIDVEFERGLAEVGVTVEEILQSLGEPDGTDQLIKYNVAVSLLREAAQRALTSDPEFLATMIEERPEAITTVCARHILVATAEDAAAVFAQLEAGEDFTQLANLSLDSSPGGDLGCQLASSYVAPFAAATLVAPFDEPFGPFQTDFGWHVVVVSDRSTPSPAEVVADPERYVPADEAQAEWNRWINELVAEADISVAGYIGTWEPDALGIQPPD